MFAREQLPCLLCGGGDACGEMGAGEGEFDQFGDFAFVFNDEDMRIHGIRNLQAVNTRRQAVAKIKVHPFIVRKSGRLHTIFRLQSS